MPPAKNAALNTIAVNTPKSILLPTKKTIRLNGSPYGSRTRVTAVRGQRPKPLDERAKGNY